MFTYGYNSFFNLDYYEESLGLKFFMSPAEIDAKYFLSEKTEFQYFEWKIFRDFFYKYLFIETKSPKKLYNSGFMDNKIQFNKTNTFYQLDKNTTPFDKLGFSKNKRNVILLSCGSFAPIHRGHINSLELAKNYLEKKLNINVAGGYISLSHDDYVLQKPDQDISMTQSKRYNLAFDMVKNNNWIMIDSWQSLYLKNEVNFTDTMDRLKKYIKQHFMFDFDVFFVYGDDNYTFNNAFIEKGFGICINRCDNKLLLNKNVIYIEENPFKGFSSSSIRKGL